MRLFLITIALWISAHAELHSQITGGRGNGQSAPAEVQATPVTAGGFSGNVSLFTGIYNSSYNLGTVAEPSGLSFTATLSYSSTFSSGDNLPYVSGVPYGEGWNVDIPTISVTTEDYSKYTKSQLDYINRTNPPPATQPYTATFNSAERTREGDIFWFAPTVNIPGVASGRMVYKYMDGNDRVFVLHEFERYVEARMIDGGYTWEVILDDGTRYEFQSAMINVSNAPNQRVPELNLSEFDGKNMVLPKTSFVKWVCTKMYHRNKTGAIRFSYEGYGCFDYYKELNQGDINGNMDYYWNTADQTKRWKPCKELILKEISSATEKLVFGYKTVFFSGTNATGMLQLTDPTVSRTDSMYNYKTASSWSSSFSGWSRYKHIKAYNVLAPFTSATNPYQGKLNMGINQMTYLHRTQISTGSEFDHGYLESPGISVANLPTGDLYEIKTQIQKTGGVGGATDHCLFDINVATGANSSISLGYSINGQWPATGLVNADLYTKFRGTSVYSTFNQGFKWYYNTGSILQTSNFFSLPNLAPVFKDIHLQIGPASSDNDYSMPPSQIGGISQVNPPKPELSYFNDGVWHSNWDTNNGNNIMQSGDPVPGNFGVGMSWYMLQKITGPGSDYYSNYPVDFWWNDNTVSTMNYLSQPTRTKGTGSNPPTLSLIQADLVRHSKNTYMLTTVSKYVNNAGYTAAQFFDQGQWHLSAQLKMEYELDQLPVFSNSKPVNSLTLKSYSTTRYRKIIKLARIRQMNIKTNTGNVPESEFPTTHFTYKTVNAGPLASMTGCAMVNGVLECNGTMYNSNNVVLWKVNNPMGQEIEVDYYNIGNQGLYSTFNPAATATDRSYSLMTYHQTPTLYNPTPQNGNVPAEMSTMRTLPESYAFQNYLVVKSIKVKDQNASPQTTDYTYGNLYLFNDDPSLSGKFTKEREANLRFQAGFDSCVVQGPTRNSKRIKTVYYHKTKEEGAVNTQANLYYDNLMWGKLYRTNTYDGDGKLSQQTRSTFEPVLAYESIRHRGFGWLDHVVAYDYMEYHPEFFKPVLTDFKSHTAWNTYVTAMHCYFGLPTDNHSNPETGGCDDGWGFYYAPEAQLVFSDPVAGQGVNEMSYFLEASPFMVGDGRFYLNSYFIKKTSDSTFVFDTELTGASFTPGTAQKSILTITRYQYFDADYRGRSNSPGYGKIGMTTQSDGYYWLQWEPSWQLYSKRTTSPQLHDAFSEEEYFYFYDLVNVAAYQTDPVNGSYYPKVVAGTKYKMLYDIWSWKQLRNLSYETRISTLAPGETESTVTKAIFTIYENDWETHREPSTYEEVENPNMPPGCDNVLGGDPGVTGGGTGGPVLPPCVIVASGNTVPPGYCYLPSATTPNRYCLCGNTPPVVSTPDPASPPFGFTGGGPSSGRKGRNEGAQLRPPGLPGSPYDDPQYFYVVSIAGMILQKYETVWVKDANAPVMSFDLVTFNPKFNAVTDTLNVYNVLSRNIYGQVVREADVRNTITYYNYGTIHNIEFENCYNGFQSLDVIPLNSHPGYPDAITVGEGRPDALTTSYTYNPDLTIASITDPNAKVMSYSYDMFGRMNQSSRNGNLVQAVTYSQWKNNLTKTFQQRLDENFVKSENYLSATTKWTEWAYLDPLGREAGSKKEITTGQSYILKNAYYDAWNKPSQARKTFLSTGTPTVTVPGGVTSADLESYQYDNEPESRPTIAAKFGQTVGSANTVQTSYGIISNTTLNSFLTTLGLTNNVLGTWFYFTKTRDEDGKYTIELKNALGQKVASIGNNGQTATTFVYNSHGQVKEVRNPLGQTSQYTYNYLGHLQQMTTPDEGTTAFVYDEGGLLLARRDARNITRLYKYDNYGRMTEQIRKTSMTTAQTNALFANSGEFWTTDRVMAAYTPLWSNFYYYEKRWFFNTVQSSLVSTYATTNTQNYVTNNTTYSLGKPTMLLTYGSAGSLVEIRYLSYNLDGFLKWEINQFNFNGLSTSAKGMVLAISYPDYNRQGSVLTQNIDLDCDGVLDFQYYNEYDNWNRQLRTYANYSDAKNTGTKIVELLYDNIVGAIDKKTYFDHASGCTNVQVDQVDYDYDARFRLTRIGSTLFDYDLKYDGNAFTGFTTNVTYNYNGNINAVKPYYKFGLVKAIPANFSGAANVNYWNFTYDNLSRLTKADGNMSGAANWGDSEYVYDKAGNITTLKRYSYDYPPGTLAQDIFAYTYTAGTNKLSTVTRNGAADRSITYDANGNMYTDSKRKIANVSYGRMNLPFNQAITVAANTVKDIAMLYDMSDTRIFKRSVTTIGNTYPPNATVNGSEYYIHTLAGQEIGVYDFLNDKLTWYVFAGDRVAKIEHTLATTYGDGIDPGNGGGGSGGGGTATGGNGPSSKIFPSAKYSDMASIEANAAETGKLLLGSLRKVLRSDGQLQLPATLVLVEYPDQKQAWMLKTELTKVKGGYTEKTYVTLDDPRSQLEIPMADGSSQAIVLGEALGIFRARQKPFVQGYDPSVQPLLLLAPPPPPIPQPVFYIYDHLGNTRVTFHVDITCPSTKSYVLDYAAEYYPYGKTMRDYTNGTKEKYETTQHERDQESGLDYRGARFYDGDIARFLSVDPMAKDYASLAPYVYVANNPMTFIDPDGKKIVLPGYTSSATVTDKRVGAMALALMSRLTNDKLSVTPTGEVFIERSGAANRGKNLEYGTKLLDDLMSNDHTLSFSEAGAGGFATFAKQDGKRVDNPEFGVEYDAEINIPLSARNTPTVNADGTKGGLPVFISLGHEMIHALHNFLGQNEKSTLLPDLIDPDSGDAKIKGLVTKEELKARNDENEIRCEQEMVNRAIPYEEQK
ncbi:MAG: RHS repeat-associated core domain-containing protein [Saprospiraceae bacterium]|nr:RHS repeat-associated core domain-containing protein [Saprospiraceae bacterium]